MTEKKRNNGLPLQWVIPFIILFATWSFLGGWITLFSREWIWLMVGVLALPSIVPHFFKTKAFIALSVYILVVFMNHISGDEYYDSVVFIVMDICQLLFYGGICYYITQKPDERVVSLIIYFIIFVIIFTSIATYYADLRINNIVRTVISYSNLGVDYTPYYRMGVCEYTMPHSLPVLIPPLVLWIKSKGIDSWTKFTAITVLFFLILLVWTSASTTALLVMLLSFAISIVINPNKDFSKNIGRIIIVGLLFLPLTFSQVQLNIIHTLENVMPDENFNKQKLSDFETRILYGENAGGDLNTRVDLYNQSLETFSQNILLGSNSKKDIGGHSVLMDRLAMLGLVGIIPLLLFFWYLFNSMLQNTLPRDRLFLIIGFLCFLLMIFLKNVYNSWIFIAAFVLLPGLIHFVRIRK